MWPNTPPKNLLRAVKHPETLAASWAGICEIDTVGRLCYEHGESGTTMGGETGPSRPRWRGKEARLPQEMMEEGAAWGEPRAIVPAGRTPPGEKAQLINPIRSGFTWLRP